MESKSAIGVMDNRPVPLLLRRLVVVGTPLALLGLEFAHPVFTSMEELLPSADRWLVVHVIQIPLFGLMAVAVHLLVNGLRGQAATISRMALWVFIVFYIALDAISGVTIGIQLQHARGLDAEQMTIVVQAADAQFEAPIVYAIGAIGTIGWLVGVLAAATALQRAGAPRLSVALLVPAAVIFALNHEPPLGPIAFGCFFLAAARLELVSRGAALEAQTTKVTDQ